MLNDQSVPVDPPAETPTATPSLTAPTEPARSVVQRLQIELPAETAEAPGAAGWLAVCVDSFPLGWGKRSGGTVKNHYPKGLRVTGASHK